MIFMVLINHKRLLVSPLVMTFETFIEDWCTFICRSNLFWDRKNIAAAAFKASVQRIINALPWLFELFHVTSHFFSSRIKNRMIKVFHIYKKYGNILTWLFGQNRLHPLLIDSIVFDKCSSYYASAEFDDVGCIQGCLWRWSYFAHLE